MSVETLGVEESFGGHDRDGFRVRDGVVQAGYAVRSDGDRPPSVGGEDRGTKRPARFAQDVLACKVDRKADLVAVGRELAAVECQPPGMGDLNRRRTHGVRFDRARRAPRRGRRRPAHAAAEGGPSRGLRLTGDTRCHGCSRAALERRRSATGERARVHRSRRRRDQDVSVDSSLGGRCHRDEQLAGLRIRCRDRPRLAARRDRRRPRAGARSARRSARLSSVPLAALRDRIRARSRRCA